MVSAVLFASLATAVAASVPFNVHAVEGYDWSITNWAAGCDDEGCHYDFNVSAPADNNNPARPAFLAYCTGGEEGGPYEECDLLDEADVARRVVAKLLPSTPSNTSSDAVAHIQLSFKYTDLETSTTWWNFTGDGDASYNEDSSTPLTNFTIKPDSITAAA
ncbi:hypothetical protein LQW54_003384 [Pestalotiopsis sp. IQ-011]|nr:hypothetical protein BJ166DRAFT_589404 [Pestalotiopsis sp. NC0098]KAI4600741.1 hypothetical protein KJ359_012903 [Pestalotiopsis sp. 9143b]